MGDSSITFRSCSISFAAPWSGAGAIGDSEVELGVQRGRCQGDRPFQLTNRGVGVGRRQRGAEIGASVGVVGRQAHCLAQRRDPGGIVARLNQHQAKRVVKVGGVGLQPHRLAELRHDRAGLGAGATEHAPEEVVSFCALRGRKPFLLQSCNRGLPVRRRD